MIGNKIKRAPLRTTLVYLFYLLTLVVSQISKRFDHPHDENREAGEANTAQVPVVTEETTTAIIIPIPTQLKPVTVRGMADVSAYN